MYFVTATDKFLSGWGKADNKINKIVVEVDNYQDAQKAYDKLMKRNDMKYVNISSSMPYYSSHKYYVSMYDLNNNYDWIR